MFTEKKQVTLGCAMSLAIGVLAASAAHADQPAAQLAKDPETGALRAPTAQESAALSAKTAKQAVAGQRGLRTGIINPPAIRHADGTVEQELTESSLTYSVATRNSDGTVSWTCVTGPAAAKAAMNSKPTSVAKEQHNDR